MKKGFLTLGIVASLSLGLALAGMTACNIETFTYDNAGKYSVGEASMTSAVTEIEVDWISGNVNVVYGDVENVAFAETATETLSEDTTVHYWLEKTTLHIKYAKSGIALTNKEYPDKDLTVTLPNALSLNKIEIETVEADVTLTEISAVEVELDSVAGNIVCGLQTVSELSVDTISGDIEIVGKAVADFDVETVSGNVQMTCETAPKRGSFDSVSGDFTLKLPAETGFSVELENANGSFESEFETTKNGNKYVCGNGENAYEIEIGTGKVRIVKAV